MRRPSLTPSAVVKAGRPPVLAAADYYFAPTGNDTTGDGSAANPFQTVAKAAAIIQALPAGNAGVKTFAFQDGGTFPDGGGLYINRPNIRITSWYGGKFTIQGTGDAIPVTIYVDDGVNFALGVGTLTLENFNVVGAGAGSNQPGLQVYADHAAPANYGDVTIRNVCASANPNSFGILVMSGNTTKAFNSISIQGCEAYGNRDGIATYGQAAGSAGPVSIRNCYAHDNLGGGTFPNGSGIIVGGASSGVVEFCTAARNGSATSDGGVGIYTYLSTGLTIQYCESYDNTANTQDGDGFDIDGGCTNCVIQYCYSHGNKAAGFLMWANASNGDITGCTIRYNVSIDDGRTTGWGALVLGQQGAYTVKTSRFHNNTVLHVRGDAYAAGVYKNGGVNFTSCYFANNILYTAGSAGAVIQTPAASGVTFLGNNYAGATTRISWSGTAYPTVASWITATGQEKTGAYDWHQEATPQWSLRPIKFTPWLGYEPAKLGGAKISPTPKAAYPVATLGWSLPLRDYFGNPLANQALTAGAHQNGM